MPPGTNFWNACARPAKSTAYRSKRSRTGTPTFADSSVSRTRASGCTVPRWNWRNASRFAVPSESSNNAGEHPHARQHAAERGLGQPDHRFGRARMQIARVPIPRRRVSRAPRHSRLRSFRATAPGPGRRRYPSAALPGDRRHHRSPRRALPGQATARRSARPLHPPAIAPRSRSKARSRLPTSPATTHDRDVRSENPIRRRSRLPKEHAMSSFPNARKRYRSRVSTAAGICTGAAA